MAGRYRRFTRIVFIILNSIVAVMYLLACLAPGLDPVNWWPVSLLGLAFGFLFVTLVAFIFFWLIFKPRMVFISIISLLFGWKSIPVFFAFNSTSTFNYARQDSSLRVASWNVARFVEWKRNNNKGSRTRLKMMDLIKEQNADILCLQEFFTSHDSIYYNNLNHVMKELGYPYYYYSWDDDGHLQWMGQIIFSRIPFVDTGMIRFPKPSAPESMVHVDVVHNGDTIRIYTTHLQSVEFKRDDFEAIEGIKEPDQKVVKQSRSIFGKLKRGVIRRSAQARVVRDVIAKTPYPYVLTGDFNDVPTSYSYKTIRDNDLQDVFLEKGFGVGRTYMHIAPNLRIDYILTTKNFTIRQFNRVMKNFSDHYMLVVDLELKKSR